MTMKTNAHKCGCSDLFGEMCDFMVYASGAQQDVTCVIDRLKKIKIVKIDKLCIFHDL